MANDEELVQKVREELLWEPRVDPDAIAVAAEAGWVTLRGTVGSFREKHEAGKAAARVFGVVGVRNGLEVRLLTEHRRHDAELRGDVLQALMLDGLVPATVDARVDDGIVTLTGTAGWQYQRDEAAFVAGNIRGTIDVINEIELVHLPTPRAESVREEIANALRRSAVLDAGRLRVTTSDGTVTIEGTVRSWAEHDDALAAAWAAPGGVDVHDRMTVEY
jgi:osmotically-inducible protein OsmY